MDKAKKEKIEVRQDDFAEAINAETCFVWATKFLHSDTPLLEEIEEIETTIDNERIWRSGSINKEDIEMHSDNIINLNAYLVWLQGLENLQERAKENTMEQSEKDLQNQINELLGEEKSERLQKVLQKKGKSLQEEVQAYLEKLYEDNVQTEEQKFGESSVQTKMDTPSNRINRCIVQLRYKGKDCYFSIENTATVLEVASAYHDKVMDRLGKDELEKLGGKFGNIVPIPEGSYILLTQSMNINNTIRVALKFDFDNGLLSVCDNKKGKWRTYDLDTISLAVLTAEQPDYSTDKERQMDFKEALRGKALSEADIQNRIKEVNGKWVEQKNERILCAAYGRFLSVGLMRQCCPYARLVGTGEIKGYELEFRGDEYDAEATLIKNEKSAVPVAVWKLGGRAKVNLDYCENYPSLFRKTMIPVELHNGETVECMAYVMEQEMGHGIPNDHYCSDVSQGYEDHDFDIDILSKALKKSAKLYRAEERAAKTEQQGELPSLVQDGGIKM